MFCNDTDLLLLEPPLFALPEFTSFRRLAETAATLSGATLTLSSGPFTSALTQSGMVISLLDASGQLLAQCELIEVTDATHAVVSVPRVLASDAPIPPAVTGVAKITLISFMPQIAAISAELLRLLGAPAQRDAVPPAVDHDSGLRTATVFGTLAALYASAAASTRPTTTIQAKADYYRQAFIALRRAVSARLDLNSDGIPETTRHAAVRQMRAR